MKKLLFLLMIGSVAYGQQIVPQNGTYTNKGRAIRNYHGSTAKSDTVIFLRTYTTTTADTTEVLNAGDFKTIYLVLQSLDTAKILVKYALSTDGVTFPAYATIDSLSSQSSSGTVKSVDLTSTIGGAAFVKFIFAFDVKAFSWANLAAKKYSAYFVPKKY